MKIYREIVQAIDDWVVLSQHGLSYPNWIRFVSYYEKIRTFVQPAIT